MKNKFLSAGIALACALSMPASQAGVSLSRTRIVFDGKHKEASVIVNNDGDEALIQAWLDPLDDASPAVLPFAITPPLARLPANRQQMLRVLYEGVGVPSDRESAFWLNVQEIPQSVVGENVLQLAVRQRIKVFYRPVNLKGEPQQAPASLRWKFVRRGGSTLLHVENPSVYHVTIVDADLRSVSTAARVIDAKMIAPGASADVPVNVPENVRESELAYQVMNDFGGRDRYHVTLSTGEAHTPVEAR